jgi:hypothetical protein
MKINAHALANFESSADGSEVTLRFLQEGDQELEISLPLESVSKSAPELLRMCMATEQKKMSVGAAQGGYEAVAYSPVANVDVRLDATRAQVLLVFDKGTPKQIAFVIPPAGAKRMAEGLMVRAASCEKPQTGH